MHCIVAWQVSPAVERRPELEAELKARIEDYQPVRAFMGVYLVQVNDPATQQGSPE